MTRKRRQHSKAFKFKVALEAVSEQKSISEIASEYEVHPTMVRNWKKQLLEEGAEVFGGNRKREEKEKAAQEAELYEQIGRLKMELEWLKKKAAPYT